MQSRIRIACPASDPEANSSIDETIAGDRRMDILRPDDVAAVFSLPFVVAYWPLILGGLTLFVIAVRGSHWMMFPVGALFILLQLWHMGAFA
jgi:hypothetical protein